MRRSEKCIAEVYGVGIEAAGRSEGREPIVLSLDAEGGDRAPEEVVAGALMAASTDLRVLLVGRPDVIEPLLAGADSSFVEIVPSSSVISYHDEPASAVKNKRDSSIVVGALTVADGRSRGFVSAGSTGAMLAAGLLVVRRVPGIRRPAILTVLPGLSGPLVFLDAGANADCRPEYLVEFGAMGTAYARRTLGQANPTVGLLNIGEEESKGNDLTHEAFPLLKALPIARRVKQRILAERQLTATVGIAANKLLAKIASDHQKPDGLTLIAEGAKVQFLRPLPLRALYGVGKVTEQALNQAGLRTVGDLQDHTGDLRALVGSFGPKLKQFAFGQDDRPLELGDEIKSISGEETFLQDTEDRKVLRACLREQAEDISGRLKRRRLGAHTVQVKVRYGDFTTLTRQITVEEPLTEAGDIYRLGCFLLGREKLVSRPLRLLGLGVASLREPTGEQLVLL